MKQNKHYNRSLVFILPFLLLLLATCENQIQDDGALVESNNSISQFIIENEEDYSYFEQMLKEGDLFGTLKAYNPNGNGYTLFLPTNEAVIRFVDNNATYANIEELMNDKEFIYSLVRYHVVNNRINRTQFPFGALPDTTLTGDFLTMVFSNNLDSTILKVNNIASLTISDIEVRNGVIHVINEILPPVVFNSYEVLQQNSQFSIFTKALEETGLIDLFEAEAGETTYPAITVLAEPDYVYAANGINNFEELAAAFSPDNAEYTSIDNDLYQFIAYHILEGKHFTNNLEEVSSNYNTYGTLPVAIAGGQDIAVNINSGNYANVIAGHDTLYANYIAIDFDNSNIRTLNGPIHSIGAILERFEPAAANRTFQFFEEPIIENFRNASFVPEFTSAQIEQMEYISYEGTGTFLYRPSISGSGAFNNDYLYFNRDFDVTYTIPKVLPGRYRLFIRARDNFLSGALVQVYFDGKLMTGKLDLTEDRNPYGSYHEFSVGIVDIGEYKAHDIRIESIVPGSFYWDAVILEIEN